MVTTVRTVLVVSVLIPLFCDGGIRMLTARTLTIRDRIILSYTLATEPCQPVRRAVGGCRSTGLDQRSVGCCVVAASTVGPDHVFVR